MSSLIETRELCRYFGNEETRVNALKQASLTLEDGEFTAIIEPSGPGKTTLLPLM